MRDSPPSSTFNKSCVQTSEPFLPCLFILVTKEAAAEAAAAAANPPQASGEPYSAAAVAAVASPTSLVTNSMRRCPNHLPDDGSVPAPLSALPHHRLCRETMGALSITNARTAPSSGACGRACASLCEILIIIIIDNNPRFLRPVVTASPWHDIGTVTGIRRWARSDCPVSPCLATSTRSIRRSR